MEAYARVGFDLLTYATVRSIFQAAHALPNIRHVDNRDQAAVVSRAALDGNTTIAVSLGEPSMEPEVWRKDVRRAKERIGRGQILIVSVLGTHQSGRDAEALAADYAQCAVWAEESGADAVELQLAAPDPFIEQQPQMIYENVPLAARILHRTRTMVGVPVLAKLGPFKTPRLLHDTATRLAPWAHGYVLVHSINRRVLDDKGTPAFEGTGRERADVCGAQTFTVAARQIAEMLAWRKAGAWDRAVLAVGGISTVERARDLLREGADAVLVATAALFDPLFAARFRQIRTAAVA